MKPKIKIILQKEFRNCKKKVKRKFSRKNTLFPIKMGSFLVRVHLHKANMNLILIKVKEYLSPFFIKIPSKMIILTIQENLLKEQMAKNISWLSIAFPPPMIFCPRFILKTFYSLVKENKRPMISSQYTLRINL